jgi:NADH pyrophosphatase NudC (nudix superfamily)
MNMANEKQLIYVEPIKKFIVDRLNSKNAMEAFGYDAIEILEQIEFAHTVDAVEVVHGRWIRRGNEMKCSECKFIYYSNHDDFNYCPNCGAKMDEETKFVGICEHCVYRDECEWPRLHPKIKLKECPDFSEGVKNKNG